MRRLFVPALLGVSYYAAGRLSLKLAVIHPSASAVWPPTGIAIASLLLLGRRAWPVIAAGAFLVNLQAAGSVLTAAGIAAGNTLEGLLGAFLAERFAEGAHAFKRARSVFRFAAVATLASTPLSATVGVLSLVLGGFASWHEYGSIWMTWWLGDAVGALTVTPLLVSTLTAAPEPWRLRRIVEASLLALALAGVATLLFAGVAAVSVHNYPLAYLCFPLLVWAAYRFGPRGAAIATAALSAVATWGTVHGFGPFARVDANASLLLLQGYVGITAMLTLVLAAVVWELRTAREGLERKVRERTEELEEAQALVHIGSWHWEIASNVVTWSPELYRIYGIDVGAAVNYQAFLERVHPEDRREVDAAVAHSRASGEPFEFQHRILRPDGGVRWTLGRGKVARGADGRARAMFGTSEDITARKHAELSVARLAAIVESSDAAIVGTTIDGRITSWNPGAERLYGYAGAEVLGKSISLLVPPGHGGDPQLDFERLAAGERVQRETWHRTREGTLIEVDLTASAIRDPRGRIIGFSKIVRDITEWRRAEQERQEGALLRIQLEAMARHTREISLLNEMSAMLRVAFTLAEAYPLLPQFLRELFPGDQGAIYAFDGSPELLEAVARWGDPPPAEDLFEPDACWALRRGQLHAVESPVPGASCRHVSAASGIGYLCLPIVARGQSLGVLHLRFPAFPAARRDAAPNPRSEYRLRLARTVAEQIALALTNVRLRETLRVQASQDPLTALFNRRHLEDSLEREFYRALRRDTTLGAIMLDIDHFKQFNDRFGHEAGDLALREVAALLSGRARREDIVCRYGGEEFLLVLPECSLDGIVHFAEELCAGIARRRLVLHGAELPGVTVSVGVALYPDHAGSAGSLLRAADAALYRSKADGRNRVTLAPPIGRSVPSEPALR
ncbi:MAG TPA: MASE1 domain-containing protein [Candidatus Polarisedimenticolaceae bacterium]|nr:MASE1 domain-containing protein [Candidatus Polarisedimenticolaceae bacterium]